MKMSLHRTSARAQWRDWYWILEDTNGLELAKSFSAYCTRASALRGARRFRRRLNPHLGYVPVFYLGKEITRRPV